MRLFISSSTIASNTLQLSAETAHHLKNVLRKKVGDTVDIIIDQSQSKTIEITDLDTNSLTFKHLHDNPTPPPTCQITLAQGLPKQDKFSDVLRSCTELGVSQFIPLITQRVEQKIQEKAVKKKERWEKVILSAATQSQRLTIPKLTAPLTLKQLIEDLDAYDLCLICWEDESETTLKACLNNYPEAKRLLVIIGPEGGLSYEEVQTLKEAGGHTVKLADNILRTEHAGFLTASQIHYHYH